MSKSRQAEVRDPLLWWLNYADELDTCEVLLGGWYTAGSKQGERGRSRGLADWPFVCEATSANARERSGRHCKPLFGVRSRPSPHFRSYRGSSSPCRGGPVPRFDPGTRSRCDTGGHGRDAGMPPRANLSGVPEWRLAYAADLKSRPARASGSTPAPAPTPPICGEGRREPQAYRLRAGLRCGAAEPEA